MPSTNLNPLIYDLTMLAHGTALAERMLVTWLEHMELFDKIADFDRLNRCVDSLTRIAAVRKSLIRLSILVDKQCSSPSVSEGSTPSSPNSASVYSVPPVIENSAIPDPTNPTHPTDSDPSSSAIRNPQSEIRNPHRPAVYLNHGEPAIYPPDREPDLVETRDIREVADIPPDKLHATLERVNSDLADLSSGPSTRASSRIAQSHPTHPTNPTNSDPSYPSDSLNSAIRNPQSEILTPPPRRPPP